MKISQFTVGTSRTINLGNFESLRMEASVTVDVDDAEFEVAKPQAQVALRSLMEETFKAQYQLPKEMKEKKSA